LQTRVFVLWFDNTRNRMHILTINIYVCIHKYMHTTRYIHTYIQKAFATGWLRLGVRFPVGTGHVSPLHSVLERIRPELTLTTCCHTRVWLPLDKGDPAFQLLTQEGTSALFLYSSPLPTIKIFIYLVCKYPLFVCWAPFGLLIRMPSPQLMLILNGLPYLYICTAFSPGTWHVGPLGDWWHLRWTYCLWDLTANLNWEY
jgi:hypothetical protein